MDLGNLTFDELLDAIRSDSGYQNAQAQKSNKTVSKASPEVAKEPETKVCETATPAVTEEPEVKVYEEPKAQETEALKIIEEPVQDDYEEPVSSDFEEVTGIFEEIVIENPVEITQGPTVVISASEATAVTDVPEVTEEPAAEKSVTQEPSVGEPEVPQAPAQEEERIFTPPATPISLFETDGFEEEEVPVWHMPGFNADAYRATAPKKAEPAATAAVDESVYTPPVTAEPIELIPSEENAEEEPIRIYIPRKPEAIDFGGINISADVSSLFPDVPKDDSDYVAQVKPAIDKTRVINPVADDKTRAIPSASDDKTRVIPNANGDKTRVIPTAGDDRTRAVDFNAVFERPGIVTASNAYEKTSDLNALPHILPADEFIDNEPKKFVRTGEIPKIAPSPKSPIVRHEEDEQMVLPGFFDKEEIIRVDEDVVEEELKRTRSRKVKSFRLEGAEIDETAVSDEVSQEFAQLNGDTKKRRFSTTKTHHRITKQRVEFNRPSDGRAVHGFITSQKLKALLGTAVAGICTLVLLITTGFSSVAESIDAGSSDIPTTYYISLIGLAVAIIGALPACISGVTCFFNGAGKPNSQTPVIVAAAAALIQNIVAIITYNGETYPLFALAAAFLLCSCSFGNVLIYSRTGANFAFLYKQGREGLHTVRSIDNALDANRVSQNVVMGDADIRYSGKAKFADKFMAYSLSSDSADDLCAKLVPVLAGVSLVIAIIGGIVTKSFAGAVTVFSGTLCMGAPACAIVAANLPLLLENKKLREDGAIISGYAAAFEYESTNAVAIDASELFPGKNCNIHGMKTFNGVRVDDAVLTAASMLIAAGGPISSLFKNVIMEHNELLLDVEDLKYEERLGLTGWVRNRRVFVGNRKLLENHNIEIPMSVDESKYVGGDRQIIYLADAGKIAAFFVVSYGRNEKIAEYLRQIENNGINILVRTTDSNINEKFIARCFDLPLNSVKVVSNTASDVLKNYMEHTVPRESAKLIHNGAAAAFLHAVSSASKLCAIAGKISTLQTFCMVAGLLLTVLIMIFSGPLSLTALPVCISQFVWIAIAAIIPLFEKE